MKDHENKFREWLIKELNIILKKKKKEGKIKDYGFIKNFGLDIAIFIKKKDNSTIVKFLELKVYSGARNNGVGFGTPRGKGIQVEILKDNILINLTNNFVRWILYNKRGSDEKKYVIFDNFKAKDSTMEFIKEGKQNNFKIKDLMEISLTEREFFRELEKFLIE